MKFESTKHFFLIIAITGLLLISTPVLNVFVSLPRSEAFSEFYVLDNNHMMTNYPFNIIQGQTYSVFLGVINHMYSSAYYKVNVKFCKENDQLPNLEVNAPSPIQTLYTYRLLLEDGGTSESTLIFSFPHVDFSGKRALINSLVINGEAIKVEKSIDWNVTSTGFYCQLFFELWLYNASSSEFQFANQFVGFWFNMTQ
jgi:hypothetical protein